MNKLLFTLCCLFGSTSLLFSQANIAEARGMMEGTTVTITGIVTNGDELGIIRYIQDATAGLPAYPGMGSSPNFPETVKRGDSIVVTGVLKVFNGLLEIDPIMSYSVVTSNNPVPAPKVIAAGALGSANEAELVRIEGITFDDAGGVFSTGNYTFSANGQEGEIYIRTNHELIGKNIPLATANLTGLSSQFNGAYQLLLRDEADLEIASNFYINSAISQSDLELDGFTVNWTTNVAGSSGVRYGTDITDLSNEVNDGGSTTDHSVTLTGLDAAEFYYVQAFSNDGSATVNSAIQVYSTASNSSGVFQIYFNFGVDGNISNGSYPNGYTPKALLEAIIDRINKAKTSIDVSMYNINRTDLVAALTAAYERGVQVRYITDLETNNVALSDPAPPFPVVKGNTDGLMHNKYFAIDANSESESWLIMGSTNMTEQNIGDDRNNTIFLQDQALVKSYTIEFEEMWGSSDPTPGIFNQKFGPNKANNTPHLFKIRNMEVESYFSPSDNTTIAITNAIATADSDIEFGLLVFTNNELGSAIVNAHNDGVAVRGIIEQINSQSSEFEFLQNSGVQVLADNMSGQIHHKYCIIDATNPTSDPQVITGSHNWSGGAETRNDENTLIFHDKNIANIFLQEFEARWCETTGGGSCITATENLNEIEGFEVQLAPNPATDYTLLDFSLEKRDDLTISLWNADGRLLQARVLRGVQGHQTEELLLAGWSPGNYFVSFSVNGKYAVKPLQVVR